MFLISCQIFSSSARFEKFKNMDKMDSLSSETSTSAGGQKSTVENHEMDFWGLVKLDISLQSEIVEEEFCF